MKALIAMFVALAVGLPAVAGEAWKLDEELGVQVAYLPGPAAAEQGPVLRPYLSHIADFRPDIDNIVYKDIIGLGFPLPSRPDPASLKLFLKIYAWPKSLDAVLSTRKIFDDFLLYRLPGGERLYSFTKRPGKVLIKGATIGPAAREFSAANPLHAPAVPTQDEFDSRLPYSSIYVQPSVPAAETDEASRAAASAGGVLAAHSALLRAYETSLKSWGAADGKHLFGEVRRCPDDETKVCGVRLLEVPVQPLVFANYRDLPMPQDSAKVFLSGLLLVKLTDYAARAPIAAALSEELIRDPSSVAFTREFTPVRSHMLEIASVFDTRGREAAKSNAK